MNLGYANSSRAFTLVELMIGATLSAAIMAAVLSSYIYLGRSLARLANQQTLEAQARRTLGYFAQDTQIAIGLADTANLTASHVTLTVPTNSGTANIVYHYNPTNKALYRGLYWSASTTYAIGDVVVSGGVGYRCIVAHSNQTPPSTTYWTAAAPLLSNLLSLSFRYYDSSGSEYTTYTNYLLGIKQVALSFQTQLGTAAAGTQTQPYNVASSRLVMRNKPFLP